MSSLKSASPDAKSTTARNPRRRQRISAEDGSSRQQQPQRKRHKAHGNGFRTTIDAEDDVATPRMNGHVSGNQGHGASTSPSVEIPVRGKQQHGVRRGPRDEGSVILTKNANYTVKHIPRLPENVKLSRREALRGTFLTSAGYALALTRTQAVVWDYTSSSSANNARIFTLQHPSRPSEPLPFGAIVTSGSGGEVGLLVINATSGKITYWESVENAEALSLFEKRRNGMTGSCGSLISGETLVDIETADPVGFILRFSSGRTAQLLLRDLQSRPGISVRFLQSQRNTPNGGFLSGLKSVFTGGTWMKNVVAARAYPSSNRGFVDTILASEDANFQFWQLGWTGQILLQGEVDAKMVVESAAKSTIPRGEDQSSKVNVIDFTVIRTSPGDSKSLSIHAQGAEGTKSFDLLILVAVINDVRTSFALVEVETTEHKALARRIIPLNFYAPDPVFDSGWVPRVCLPRAQDTAFIVFENAIVLVSLATVKLSPEAQILMDVENTPEPFQDVIYLKKDHHFCIAGVDAEDGGNAALLPSSILLFVGNCGIMRITTVTPLNDEQAIQRPRVSAKSKIEEAVYFGSVVETPLDLFRKSERVFPIDEIETAALETSKEVCATDSEFLPGVAPSMDHHLEQRARVLESLASYLKQYSGISRVTRWKLRWDAEKMAAARKLWSLHNAELSSGADSDTLLLPKILFLMNDKHKTVVDEERGERDRVRQWFLKDVWRMENLVAWPWRAIEYLEKENEIKDMATYFQHLKDAGAMVLASLETAFKFRADSAALYDLQDEELTSYGVLASGYGELPEFWTSTYPIQHLLPTCISTTMRKVSESGDEQLAHHAKVVDEISEDMPCLIDIYCKCSEERYRWYGSRSAAKERAMSEEIKQTYERHRYHLLQRLPEFGQTMPGFSLAEQYRDMDALVLLIQELSASELLHEANRDDPRAKRQVEAIEKRVKRYFSEYKDDWANAFYSYQISRHSFTRLLDQASTYGAQLTRYLRAEPTRQKLSWINDVLGERACARAGDTLLHIAEEQETDLWSKKVELSIAKLALVASQTEETHSKASDTEGDRALQLVKLQERLYNHVQHSFYDAVDQPAELQLAMNAFGVYTVKGRPNLQQLLEQCMEHLIKHEAMDVAQLVDVFTLMDNRPSELGRDDISGREYYFALEALKLARSNGVDAENDLLLKITYRRCFIKDDWRHIDGTAQKSDQDAMDQLESTTLFSTIYEGYASGLWNIEHGIPIFYPDDVLGAGTTPNELKLRFPDPDLGARLAKDLAYEDGVLQHLVGKYRLNHWIKAAENLAKERLRGEAETGAARGEKVREVVSQLEGEREDLEQYKGGNSVKEAGEGAAKLSNGV